MNQFYEFISLLGTLKESFSHRYLGNFLYLVEMDYYELYSDPLLGLTFTKDSPVFIWELGEYLLGALREEIIEIDMKRPNRFGLGYHVLKKHANLNKQLEVVIENAFNLINGKAIYQVEEYIKKDVPIMTEEEGNPIQYQSVFYRTDEYSAKQPRSF